MSPIRTTRSTYLTLFALTGTVLFSTATLPARAAAETDAIKTQATDNPYGQDRDEDGNPLAGSAKSALENMKKLNDAAEKGTFARTLLTRKDISATEREDALNNLFEAVNYEQRYLAYYRDLKPEANVAQMQQDAIFAAQELTQLCPSNGWYAIRLANEYIMDNADSTKAETVLKPLYKTLSTLPPKEAAKEGKLLVECLLKLADCAVLRGDQAEILTLTKELAAKVPWGPRFGLAKAALQWLSDDPALYLDAYRLPIDSGAKVFPTPQNANYTDDFTAPGSVKIVVGDTVAPAVVTLLKLKLNRFGLTVDDNATFTIEINTPNTAGLKAPQKHEGYALQVTKNGANIQGRGSRGPLWGAVSLIQLVDQKNQSIRVCTIEDWPVCPVRGGTDMGVGAITLELALFGKLNLVMPQYNPCDIEGHYWSPFAKYVSQARFKAFSDLGIDSYYTLNMFIMAPKLPLSNPRTLKLYTDTAEEFAKFGAGVYAAMDDNRFPLHQADIDAYGTAANMDGKFLTKWYRAVKAKYPTFKMTYCPPYYWGPEENPRYPETRDSYLRSLAKDLDPEIPVIWTGAECWGYEKTKADVDWITQRVGRKPLIFNNRPAKHSSMHYVSDVQEGFTAWHYDGFFASDIAGYCINTTFSGQAPVVLTMADAAWNPTKYDAEASIRRVDSILAGPGLFDLIDPANQAISHFDQYDYRHTLASLTDPKAEVNLQIAEESWKKASEYLKENKIDAPYANYLSSRIGWLRALVKQQEAFKQDPHMLVKEFDTQVEELKQIAATQVGYKAERGDIFISPTAFIGGDIIVARGRPADVPRVANIVRALNDPARVQVLARMRNKLDMKFSLPEANIGKKTYVIVLCAQQDEQNWLNRPIRYTLNGTVIFDGTSDFARQNWNTQSVPLPADLLRADNVFTFELLGYRTYNHNSQPQAWTMVNYAVVREIMD